MLTKLMNLIIALCYVTIIAQNSTCETPSDNGLLDLNTISVSKCNTEDNSSNRKVTTSSKDRNSHYIRKKQTTYSNSNSKITNHEVLFSLVDEVPLFDGCFNKKDRKCFRDKIKKHFSKHFHPENASDDGINGKVFIQFTITDKGKTNKIKVRGPKNATKLKEEVERVLFKLPLFTPAKHQGIPVAVTYSLPLNFYTD